MSEAFSRAEYERVCAVLRRFYNIVITDSGTGLVHSAMEGTLALADSLIIVGALTVDGASRASKTLDWLVAHGHAELVREAVVVLSRDRDEPRGRPGAGPGALRAALPRGGRHPARPAPGHRRPDRAGRLRRPGQRRLPRAGRADGRPVRVHAGSAAGTACPAPEQVERPERARHRGHVSRPRSRPRAHPGARRDLELLGCALAVTDWGTHHPDATTAGELTEDAIVRERGDRPSAGWRRVVYGATGGRVNPGPSRDRAAAARVAAPDPAPAARLPPDRGHLAQGRRREDDGLGVHRARARRAPRRPGDRARRQPGRRHAGRPAHRRGLGHRARPAATTWRSVRSLTDVGRYTSLAGRLQVLASEQDPARSEAFNRAEYEEVCARAQPVLQPDHHRLRHRAGALGDGGHARARGQPRGGRRADRRRREPGQQDAGLAGRARLPAQCRHTRWSCCPATGSARTSTRDRIREHFEARCRARGGDPARPAPRRSAAASSWPGCAPRPTTPSSS